MGTGDYHCSTETSDTHWTSAVWSKSEINEEIRHDSLNDEVRNCMILLELNVHSYFSGGMNQSSSFISAIVAANLFVELYRNMKFDESRNEKCWSEKELILIKILIDN